MDLAVVSTVTLTLFIAALSGFLAYRFAIVQTRQEIQGAFDQHIEKLHQDHKAFVRRIRGEQPPAGME